MVLQMVLCMIINITQQNCLGYLSMCEQPDEPFSWTGLDGRRFFAFIMYNKHEVFRHASSKKLAKNIKKTLNLIKWRYSI